MTLRCSAEFEREARLRSRRWSVARKSAKATKRYIVTASVTATKFIGYFEAESEADAIEQAEKDGDWVYVGLCHQCDGKFESIEVEELFAEEVDRG
jgi:hypothetical protein